MRICFSIFICLFISFSSLECAKTPQSIAISDPLVKKIRQYGDTIWAVGRGISVINVKTKELTKFHQQYMYLASSDLTFTDIYKDNDNKYYFASNHGLWTLRDTTWEIYTSANSPLPSDSINCISPAKNGTLWLGTDKGLVRKNLDNWDLDNFGINYPVISITFDSSSDTTYICSDLHYFNILVGNEVTPMYFPIAPLMETRKVQYRKVIKDNFGVKWIATYGTYGLVKWQGDDVQQLFMENTSQSIIFDIESDAEGYIIGINGDGYFKIDPVISSVLETDYNIKTGALGRPQTAMRASDGQIWFGGTCPLTNRIAIKNPIKYDRFNNALMPGPFLNTFFAAFNGNAYLANYNGFGIFDTSTFSFYDSTTHSSKITGITDISANLDSIYVIAYNQLYKFEKDGLKDILGAKNKSYSYYGSTFDQRDSLWFTSRRFIWKYKASSIDSIQIPGPNDNFCFTDIICDKNDTKWIKTLRGYYGYREGNWVDSIMPADIPEKIRTFEDLKMYMDYNRDIWLTSINSIFKYDDKKWEIFSSAKNGVPKFASPLDKVPVLSFTLGGKMYLSIDEKVFLKDGGIWKEPKDLHPIFDRTYKLYVDINDNKWIYKAEADSVAITMFRESGVYNSLKEYVNTNTEDNFIFPNPASEYIFVRSTHACTLLDIKIYNVFGECLLTIETQSIASLERIDISNLPAGVYFVRIGNEKPLKLVKTNK